MKYLNIYPYHSNCNYIFGYKVDIIGLKMDEYLSETFIIDLV